MKKLFLMFAAVVALFATSCVTDTTSDVAVTGGECDVTLSVKAPGVDSRTIGDGLKALKLTCGVYDADWNYLTSVDGNFDGASTTTTISMRLVKGKEYNFVFWAQADGAPYTLTLEGTDNPTIAVDYSNVNANDDNLDAFFGKLTEYEVSGTVNETVYLKRPFAQINFGTSDETDAKTFGFDVVDDTTATTKVTVTTYTGLSLKSGEIVGNPTEVTFNAAALPKDKTLVTNNGNYYWLAMNYILVPENEVSLAQCDLTVTAQGQEIEVKVPMAPAKRNWRTNLVGKLLTEQGNLTIEIKPIPVDQYVGVVEVATAEEFNAAFANPEVDFIVLSDNITLTASVTRSSDPKLTVSAGQSLTIDLNNHRLIAESTQLFEVLGELSIINGTIENTKTDGKVLADNDDATLSNVTILQSTDSAYYDEQGGKLELIAEGVVKVNETGTEIAITANCGFDWLVANCTEANDGFAGKTIKLNTDIDLFKGYMSDGDFITTAPIGDKKATGKNFAFKGTFDGQGHTIKNHFQNGWALNYEWGVYGSLGLFRELVDATVKNVVIEKAEFYVEGGDVSFIAGSATGTCVFEDITIKNSIIATYNNGCGGIIGWSGAGNYTFKNIKLESDVVLGGLWGSFDSSIGGIVGQAEPGATYNFENVEINCRIDAYNDCTASYDYYNYRMCGMVIGRCEETTTIDGRNYPDLSKYNMSFNNVTVNYGQWMYYHYCEPTPGHNGGRGMRVEKGYAYGGLPEDFDHTQCVDNHYNCIPFDQLVGGDQIAVKGLPVVDGVTVNYPAAYTCPLCGQQHGK